MAKSILSVTVDHDLKQHFSNSSINLSGLINDFLRNYKDQEKSTISALNYQIKRKELEIMSRDHAKLTADLHALQSELDRYDQDREKKQVDDLKAQKERQERLIKCRSCLNSIEKPILLKNREYLLCVHCLEKFQRSKDLERFLK